MYTVAPDVRIGTYADLWQKGRYQVELGVDVALGGYVTIFVVPDACTGGETDADSDNPIGYTNAGDTYGRINLFMGI